MMDEDTVQKNNEETLFANPYRNILYCSVCGAFMQFHTARSNGKINRVTYVCSSWMKLKQCSRRRFDFYGVNDQILKALNAVFLNEIVLTQINLQAQCAVDAKKLLEKIFEENLDVRFKEEQHKQISILRKKLGEIKTARTRAFEELAGGQIIEDEYRQRMDILAGKHLKLTKALSSAESMCEMVDIHLSPQNQWLRTFSEKGVVDKLTPELVSCMIQRIDVLEDKRVHITFNYADCMESFMTSLDIIRDADTGIS